MPAAITMPMTTATEATIRGSPVAPPMSEPVTLENSENEPGR
jgi:hypothetical protein